MSVEAGCAEDAPDPWKGYAAIAFAVSIWAGWIVATRDQVGSLKPLDIALLRYGTPALLLAPIWLRRGLLPKGESFWAIAIMTIGWGGPFVMLTAKGLETVPAALFGPMVPATLPLIVAFWDRWAEGARISRERALGLVLIAVSISLIVAPAALRGDAEFLRGAPYLTLAAFGWSAFTIAYRRTRLTGLEATAYVCLWSTPFLVVASLIVGTHFGALGLGALAWVVMVQGVLSGIGAVACFGYAVRHVGVARTSSFTSLVPVGAAVGGWIFLAERPTLLDWTSVGCACLGVAIVNGAFSRRPQARPPA